MPNNSRKDEGNAAGLTQGQITALERFSRALSAIAEKTGLPSGRDKSGTSSRLSIDQIRTLLYVAANPLSTVGEIGRGTGQNPSSTSRQLLDLGIRNRNLGPGWGFIEPEAHETDLRSKRYQLTDKGRELALSVIALIGK